MALIHCPECGTEISSEAVSCPKCGKPMCEYKLQTSKAEKSSAGTFFRILAVLTWIGGLLLPIVLGNFVSIFVASVISGGIIYCVGKVVDYIYGIYHAVTNLKFVCEKYERYNKQQYVEQCTEQRNNNTSKSTEVTAVTNNESNINAENQVVLEDNENYTKFGTYPQSAEGTDKTTIEWLELTREGNKALLISRYGLDVQPFNTTQTDTTWEKCTLRTWLNDAFMSKAFTAEEQKAILHTFIDNGENQGNSKWRTIGGNNTQDRIFLLSYAEADQYFGVTYNENRKSRIAPTAYAIAHGASASTNGYKTNEGKTAGNWWLRSPGLNQNTAVRVYCAGSLSYDNVDNASCCVRPAMWVNLDSEIFRSEN